MALPTRPRRDRETEPQKQEAQKPEDFFAEDDPFIVVEDSEDASDEFVPEDDANLSLDGVGSSVETEAPATNESVIPSARLEGYESVIQSEVDGMEQQGLAIETAKPERFTRTKPVFEAQAKKPKREAARFGGISAHFAIYGDYDIVSHLEDKIHQMVNEIQDILSDHGDSEKVGQARRDRGSDLYNSMYLKIDRLITRALSGDSDINVEPADAAYFTAAVSNEILGFGPLEPFWEDPSVSEIMVNGPHEIRVEVRGKTMLASGVRFRDTEHAMKVTNNFLALASRTFSTKMPYADSSLPDGSRLNAIHPEIAPGGPYLTIRRFPDTIFSMEKLVDLGSMDKEMAYIVGNLVHMGVSTVVAGGTGTGKALDVRTPIPTPAGLIPLGELKVGDTVFDEDGKLTTVTGFFPQPANRKCYRVVFSDNSEVIADAEHNWLVNDGDIKTTAEMFNGFMSHSYAVPLAKPVQYAEQNLPIDPYVLGFWAACGNANGYLSDDQADIDKVLLERGHKFSRRFEVIDGRENDMVEVEGFADQLAEIGLLGASDGSSGLELPEAYLIASEGQRRALLGGLLDNGAILHRKNGYVELVVADNPKLATQIVRLVTSLGIFVKQQTMNYADAVLTALVLETSDDIFFAENMKTAHEESRTHTENVKHIISITPVDSVDVACISVDSPNHLYLYGNEHTVTHNTSMLNALSGCIPDDERIITVEDTLELQLNPRKHVLALRSRPANPKGEDAVTIRDLVRNTLRMRPDRIVVGEVRDASAYDMMQAMNTGHDGSLTTTHASNPVGTIERLALLTAEAGEVTPDRALSLIAGAVDVIVNIERYPEDGSRRVSTISEVPTALESQDGRLVLNPIPLWEWHRDGTNEEGRLYGHYEKVNDLSASLNRKHSLDSRKWLDIDTLFEISSVPNPQEQGD